MNWIDLSMPITSGMMHWPGDPDIDVYSQLSIDKGDDPSRLCNFASNLLPFFSSELGTSLADRPKRSLHEMGKG